MADQEVKIRISTDASGAVTGFRTLREETQKTENETAGLVGKIKGHWLGLTAAIASVAVGANQAWGMIKAGAEFDEQAGMLDNLAAKYSTTADSIVQSMAAAADQQIAKADLMQVALGGIAKGLKPEQLINLADAARILGDAAGKDATTALQELSEALETGRTRSLKLYAGTTIDLKDAFGELESKLTDAERAQAMYSLTMVHAIKLQKEQTAAVDETADKIEKMETKWANMITLVSRKTKNLTVSIDDWLGKHIIGPIEAFPTRVMNLGLENAIFGKKYGTAGPDVYEVPPIGSPAKTTDPFQKILDDLKKTASTRVDKKTGRDNSEKELDKLWKERLELIKQVAKAEFDMADEVEQGVKRSLEGIEKNAAERLTAERDMYRDMRGYEDSYFAASVALIESQAKRYRELGIEEVAIAAWVAEEKRKAGLQRDRSGAGGTWDSGWNEGVRDWGKDVNNMFVQGEKMAQTTATSMSDSFSSLFFDVTTGKFESFGDYFTSFTNSILKSWSNMLADMVTKWIMSIDQMTIEKAGNAIVDVLGGLFAISVPSAKGNVFHYGDLVPFAAGGVVSRPTIFPMSRGYGLMGEAGPEAIMPLKRTSGGKLGVSAVTSTDEKGNNEVSVKTANVTNNIYCWDSQSLQDFVRRNGSIFQNITTQGLKDNKTRDTWRTLLR